MVLSLALKMCAEQDTELEVLLRPIQGGGDRLSSSEGWGGGHAGRQLFGC